MQKPVFLGPTGNYPSSPLLLKKVLFPNYSRYANSTNLSIHYLGCIFIWDCMKYSLSISVFPLVLFAYLKCCAITEIIYILTRLEGP